MRLQQISIAIIFATGLVFAFQHCSGSRSSPTFRRVLSSSHNNQISLTLPAGYTNGEVRSVASCPSGKEYVSFRAYGTGGAESRVYWIKGNESGSTTLTGANDEIRLVCVKDSTTGGDLIYALDFTSSSIKMSTDGGRQWSQVSSGMAESDEVFMNTRGLVAELTSMNEFRISTDFGASWTVGTSPFPSSSSRSLAISSNDQGEIFVASRAWAISESTGDGFVTVRRRSMEGTWSTVDTFTPDEGLNLIRVESLDIAKSGRILLLVMGSSTTDTTAQTVFFLRKSDDNGLTWTSLTGDLLNSSTAGFITGSRLSPDGDIWYVANDGSGYRAYRSTDDGATWISNNISAPDILYGAAFELSSLAANKIIFAYEGQQRLRVSSPNTEGPPTSPAIPTVSSGPPYLVVKPVLVGP
ncbi:MAG: WD40/YVTN/BNR-like repeat-containing protein [Bdellovibrionales bacterium]